jgi:hypothetical protein
MNEKEMEFYNKCYAATSFEDVMLLAEELEKWEDTSKFNISSDLIEEQEKALEEYIARRIQEMQDAEDGEYDADFDSESGGSLTKEDIRKMIEKEKERIRKQMSQDTFDKSFKESILSNAHVINFVSVDSKIVNVVTAKKYSEYVKEYCSKSWYNQEDENNVSMITESVRVTRKSIQQSVDSMVRVFESRKAAERYKNAKVSDTGLIDVNKAYRYKFDDKIFRRSVKVPNQKNHAYYIMIDCSGSMHSRFQQVIEQVLVLTEFLRRIQVPYKVIGFGASLVSALSDPRTIVQSLKNDAASLVRYFNEEIFEILSNEQTLAEHNMAITGLYRQIGFSLGSTPTGAAMLRAEHHATKFFNAVGASKKHMVVITDGEPTDLITNSYGYSGKTLLIADPITKKVVTSKGNARYSAINCIGKIFEYRHNILFSTISLVKTFNQNQIDSFVSSNITSENTSDFRKDGYAMISDPWTKNKIFFAKPFGVDTDIDDFNVEENQTASQIARSMTKNLRSVKKSRIFLNALAESLS